MDLEALGWTDFFAAQVGPDDGALAPARVVAELGARFELGLGTERRLADPAGRLRREGGLPVVGDFVLAAPRADGGATVERVLERRSRLSRNAAGRRTEEQVLAANLDVVLVVQGLDGDFNLRRLERTLAAVWAGGASPVVVLNKADLAPDFAARRAQVERAAPGVPVEVISASLGDGVELVRAHLAPGTTGVLVGSSGAGKSTLLNALLGAEAQRTAAVREADARGRHTTTNRRLFAVPGGGLLVDGPGIRELRLWEASGLDRAFADVDALAAGCRFSDCGHHGEPGCAVEGAVAEGALDPARLESWRKLRDEAARQEARRDPAARAEEKRRWKLVSKAVRRMSRDG